MADIFKKIKKKIKKLQNGSNGCKFYHYSHVVVTNNVNYYFPSITP